MKRYEDWLRPVPVSSSPATSSSRWPLVVLSLTGVIVAAYVVMDIALNGHLDGDALVELGVRFGMRPDACVVR
jgi:hypothetical protein